MALAKDGGSVPACTRIINGGANSLSQRMSYFDAAIKALRPEILALRLEGY
jgi:predicted chitinase